SSNTAGRATTWSSKTYSCAPPPSPRAPSSRPQISSPSASNRRPRRSRPRPPLPHCASDVRGRRAVCAEHHVGRRGRRGVFYLRLWAVRNTRSAPVLAHALQVTVRVGEASLPPLPQTRTVCVGRRGRRGVLYWLALCAAER